MCLLRSVGSKQIRSEPLGFLTATKEFNHYGAGPEREQYFDIIPAFSILSNSSLHGCFHGKRHLSRRLLDWLCIILQSNTNRGHIEFAYSLE